jgi:hypothetical protein
MVETEFVGIRNHMPYGGCQRFARRKGVWQGCFVYRMGNH